jgi:hypothetical protein
MPRDLLHWLVILRRHPAFVILGLIGNLFMCALLGIPLLGIATGTLCAGIVFLCFVFLTRLPAIGD